VKDHETDEVQDLGLVEDDFHLLLAHHVEEPGRNVRQPVSEELRLAEWGVVRQG
jgi:hypothetical protein